MVLSSTDNNLFDDLNRYGPDVPEVAVTPIISERVLGKRQATGGEQPPAKKIRPRAELEPSLARTHSGWTQKDGRVQKGQRSYGTSTVLVGPSAPRGFITHWLAKKPLRQ
jgi:hypothetical protein